MAVDDITSAKAYQQPIFKLTEKIFGRLLTAPVNTLLTKEVPELNLKLITVVIQNQLRAHEDLLEVIIYFKGVCVLAFLVFALNLLITIVRCALCVYEKCCTPQAREERQRNRARAHLNEMIKIMPQVNNR